MYRKKNPQLWGKIMYGDLPEQNEFLLTRRRDIAYVTLIIEEVKVQVALIFSFLNLKKLAKKKLRDFIFFFFILRL